MLFKKTEAGMLRLTEKDLDDFADYMKSGEMEQDFRDGCEHDRLFLLSLLEKFMDVADLADETATKLIFRGNLAERAFSFSGQKKFYFPETPFFAVISLI